MRSISGSSFRGHVKNIVVAVVILWMNANAQAFTCPPGFISFGTSLSGTGNVAFALPGEQASENLPYGETFFGTNAFRFSDGRLVIDFFDLAFGYPLLSPYLEGVAPTFRRGINVAASGATALPESPDVPFYFGVQVKQFQRFKQTTRIAEQAAGVPYQTKTLLPDSSVFNDGLYIVFMDGRNDLTFAYTLQGYAPANVTTKLVPSIVSYVVDGIKNLYAEGARNFLVFNAAPQGCSPVFLTIFASANRTEYDENGCLIPYNQANQVFNSQLHEAVTVLRRNLSGSTILYFDYYQAYVTVLKNPKSYGFAADKTLVACCGVGGEYNFNDDVQCSATGSIKNAGHNVTVTALSCSNPNEYINWDGVHFTDAFNGLIAKFILSGKFLDPPINLQEYCELDFSKFTGVNFTQAYPNGYIIGSPSSG